MANEHISSLRIDKACTESTNTDEFEPYANHLRDAHDRPAVFIEQTHLDKQPADLTDC